MAGGGERPEASHPADQGGTWTPGAPLSPPRPCLWAQAAVDLGERDGSHRSCLLSLLEISGKLVGSFIGGKAESLHLGWLQDPRRRQNLGWEPYQGDFGDHSDPQRSQNSAPVTAGQRCLIPDVPALRWSSPDVPPPPGAIREGGARLAWNLSTLPVPHCCPPAPRPAPPAFILSSSLCPSEEAEETLERSIQPSGKPGVGEGATSLFSSISKVWRRCPTPRLTVLHAITYTALEELGLHQEESSSHHLPHTHPPTPTSSPPGLAPHPPVPSHPYGCE